MAKVVGFFELNNTFAKKKLKILFKIKMQKILGIGNALVDIMTSLENDNFLENFDLPKGSMQLVDKARSSRIYEGCENLKKQITAGGSAANTINGLANLGAKVGFIGKVGDDKFGKLFSEDLVKNKIEPLLQISNNETGNAMALISPDSERTFATFLGAAIELSADDLSEQLFNNYDILHIEGYLVQNHELLNRACKLAKENGLLVSIDLASYNVVEDNLEFLKGLTKKYVDIVFANEEEAKAFTGKEPEAALEEISGMCKYAIVKVGSKGSLIKSGNEKVEVGVIPVKSVDTTGAGDFYAAGFLHGLSQNLSLEQCGKLGSILAGKVIEVIGAKLGIDTWTEINKMVKEV